MERLRKQQLLEQSIYGAIWIVIFLLPLIGGYFAVSGGLEKEEIRVIVYDSWLSILPFFVLFLLNNYGDEREGSAGRVCSLGNASGKRSGFGKNATTGRLP